MPPTGGASSSDGEGVDLLLAGQAATGHPVGSAAVEASAGQLAFTGGYDGVLRVWRLDKLQQAAAAAVAKHQGSGSPSGKGSSKRQTIGPSLNAPSLTGSEIAVASFECEQVQQAGSGCWLTQVSVFPTTAADRASQEATLEANGSHGQLQLFVASRTGRMHVLAL